MRTIIAGNRKFRNYKKLCSYIDEIGVDISYVFSSGNQGVNVLGRKWAFEHDIPFKMYGNDEKKVMVRQAEDLIFIHGGGAALNILKLAQKAGLEIYEHEF